MTDNRYELKELFPCKCGSVEFYRVEDYDIDMGEYSNCAYQCLKCNGIQYAGSITKPVYIAGGE